MSEENPLSPTSSSPSSNKQSFSPTSTSFVYPVRSLLSAIQPAAPISRSKSIDHVSSLLSQTDFTWQGQGVEGAGSALALGGKIRSADEGTNFTFPDQASTSAFPSDTSDSPPATSRISFQNILSSSTHVSPTSQHSSDLSVSQSSGKKRSSRKKKTRIKSSPNYRHFPAEEADFNAPRPCSPSPPIEPTHPSMGVEPDGQGELPDYSVMSLPLIANPGLAATSTSLLPSATTSPTQASHYIPAPLTKERLDSMMLQQFPATGGRTNIKSQGQASSGDEVHSPAPSAAEKWLTPESSFSIQVETLDEPTTEPGATDAPSEVTDEVTDLPFNLSQYGLVHLPPLPSPGSSERWSGSSISSKQASSYNRGSKRRGPCSVLSDNSQSIGGSSDDNKYFSSSPEPATRSSPEGYSTGSSKAVSSSGGADLLTSTSESGQSLSGSGQAVSSIPTSVRDGSSEVDSRGSLRTDSRSEGSSRGSDGSFNFSFQYEQNEYGNHIIVGREGNLQRCEDEVSFYAFT